MAWHGFSGIRTLPEGTTGGNSASLIAKELFNHLYSGKEAQEFPMPDGIRLFALTKPHLKPNIKQSLQQRIPPTVRSFGNTFRFLLHLPKQASSGNCRLLRRMYHGEVMSAEIPQYDSPHRIHGFAIESFVPNAEFSSIEFTNRTLYSRNQREYRRNRVY